MARSFPEAEFQMQVTGLQALLWFLKIRWVVISILIGGGMLAWALGVFPTAHFLLGLLGAGGVAIYNAGFWLLLHSALGRRSHSMQTFARWAQLPFDIITTTVFLYVLDFGVISPFTILYGVSVLVAVMLLPPRGIYLVAGFAIVCYGGLLIYEFYLVTPDAANSVINYYRNQPDVNQRVWSAFFTTALALISAAFVAAQFARRLRNTEAVIGRQVADLTLLQRMAHDQAATLNVDEVLQKVTDTTQALLNADMVSVALLRPDGRAEFRVISGPDTAQWSSMTVLPLPENNPLLQRLLSGQPLLVPDIADQPALRALLVRPQTVSFYSFPLSIEQKTLGALNFSFDQFYLLSADTQTLLLALTDQAALALARARLYQEATQAAREMSSLYHIGLATSSSLNIDEVLMQIYQQVQQLLNPDTFFIALHDPRNGELCFELVTEQGQILPLHKVPIGPQSMSAGVSENRRSLLVGHWDTEEIEIPTQRRVFGLNTQSILAVPLLTNDRVVGVMSAQQVQPYAFNEDNLRLLSAIAAQAALALENARLHEEVHERAVRDSLTGAHNHGALIDRLTTAIAAAAEKGPVALIMLDVDHFKAFNDRWGHQAGDLALQRVVAVITSHIKSEDTVGRWGGEEFGVVLPGAGRIAAAGVAARIREALAAVPLIGPEGQGWPMPTVSQGVASFPDQAGNAALLVDVADGALYRAKAQGRNSIVVAGAVETDDQPAANRT